MSMRTTTLEVLATHTTDETFDIEPPFRVELMVTERLSPSVFTNLARLAKLNILTGDAIMSLVGQAPIDPINLVGTLMQVQGTGWVFSAIDFTMFRVLARTAKKTVAAALRVDLMTGVLQALVLNQANQLTVYKALEVEPREGMLMQILALCDDAVLASQREAS